MSSSTISLSGSQGHQGDPPPVSPSSWTWSLAGPPDDPGTAILMDVWIDRHGLEESLLLTVSDPESLLAHTALIPVDDHQLHEFETVLSRCVGKPLTDLGAVRVD